MSPEFVQKLISITVITGGLGGGYYALTGGGTGTLSKMHLATGRQLITDWTVLEAKYNLQDNQDIIDEIPKNSKKFNEKIKKWCESKGSTYFLDATDKTYRSYAVWCVTEVSLDKELKRLGFKWDDNHWDKKAKKYNESNQTFMKQAPKGGKITPLNESEIRAWCESNKDGRYKYPGDEAEHRMRTYCYWTEEDLTATNNPESAPETPPQLPPLDPPALDTDKS
ncbi:hypothetical protein A6V39_05260 [Candidatus Mycoplasma haematobovis]|uniref:Uncharacterized protein n=1 Tax=Candidatus Mycoplasma haematobovis TaxID=432608 RepID=A0A1A9QBJ8_9MOLU|nr:hypothetical protein [Candidatus Mycoplasma haematobovis]OAL09837.1 hypothetical protein A6V39_05260 [Candidatus Mycoplasma haematobovis]